MDNVITYIIVSLLVALLGNIIKYTADYLFTSWFTRRKIMKNAKKYKVKIILGHKTDNEKEIDLEGFITNHDPHKDGVSHRITAKYVEKEFAAFWNYSVQYPKTPVSIQFFEDNQRRTKFVLNGKVIKKVSWPDLTLVPEMSFFCYEIDFEHLEEDQ